MFIYISLFKSTYICLGGCLQLERLDLSYNDISQLHSLSPLESLLSLNLSANRIASLNGLQALDQLERLDLSGNLIGRCILTVLLRVEIIICQAFMI